MEHSLFSAPVWKPSVTLADYGRRQQPYEVVGNIFTRHANMRRLGSIHPEENRKTSPYLQNGANVITAKLTHVVLEKHGLK